jgi:hypothetical protein
MIIKAEISEVPAIEYQCAIFDMTCHVFTIESNHLMKQVEILHSDGRDLDAETAWLLHACVQNRIERLTTPYRKP